MFKNRMKLAVTVLGSALFLFLGLGSVDDDEQVEQDISTMQPAYELTAYQLYKAYEDNEVAADQKYKDKVLVVTGYVDDIGKDIMDDIYVTLKTGQYFGSIQCFFSDAHENRAAELKKGQKLKLKGKCAGKMMNVLVKGCTFQ
jgi:hypothetical protein